MNDTSFWVWEVVVLGLWDLAAFARSIRFFRDDLGAQLGVEYGLRGITKVDFEKKRNECRVSAEELSVLRLGLRNIE